MLWQKEKNSNIYVDLLDNQIYPLTNLRLNRKKNDSLSSKARANGNKKYREKDIEGAMYLYNEGICFAESSKNISLGYANRSSCFFMLGMYSQCLVDIRLAMEAGYPEHLVPKLETRKTRSEELLERQPQPTTNDTSITFEADCKLPCMANALNIERNSQYGRLVAARRDIEIGETLLVEEAYIHVVYNRDMKECSNCAKEKMNFTPCGNCADTMYCCIECQNNNFHEVECNMTLHSVDHVGGESSVFLLRSVIIAINTFSTINELMASVETCNLAIPKEISQSIASPQTKYETFFKLSLVISNQRVLDYRNKAYIIYDAIMNSSIGSKFVTTEEKRFLVHLIIHHGLVLRSNSFQLECGDDYEMKLNLLTSYINHSCMPNVVVINQYNTTVAKSILPIKQGEQLFISYVDNNGLTKSQTGVNNQLERIYGFCCDCHICKKI